MAPGLYIWQISAVWWKFEEAWYLQCKYNQNGEMIVGYYWIYIQS